MASWTSSTIVYDTLVGTYIHVYVYKVRYRIARTRVGTPKVSRNTGRNTVSSNRRA